MTRFVVLKFGGTSVASAERWSTIAALAAERVAEGLTPLIVCSAVAGVSDNLVALCAAARTADDELSAGAAESRAAALLRAVVARHEVLAAELGVDPSVLAGDLAELNRLAAGVSLLGEASPPVEARVLALGELLSTRLGAAFLAATGRPAVWLDARDLLRSTGAGGPVRRYLSAEVAATADPELKVRLAGRGVLLTQGFVARDPDGATVLLGRGGSDTSAALLAAKLGAVRCEIWTDVPGMFTADPRTVPGARLLRSLDYAEAQEIATMGAKVLHPRAVPPARAAGIPLEIRCTPRPDLPGTSIGPSQASDGARVKAVSVRRGLVLVSLETLGMWQEVGFLARAFAVFARLMLSVDTVSTSETNVTVTLDPSANPLDDAVLEQLRAELSALCQPTIVTGCASVSLVGRGIRAILHRLAPVFEVFEEHRVHLVAQAASDLNLTVVVDQQDADRLAARLHTLLFAHHGADSVLGPTWHELLGDPASTAARPAAPAAAAPWWTQRRDALLAEADVGTPAYVLDRDTLDARADALLGLSSVDEVLYACKANPHPDVCRRLVDRGLGLECVSPGELALARAAGAKRVLFTPNFAPRAEYAAALDAGVDVTLDDLFPLLRWPELFAGRSVTVRVDPGHGRGHHAAVRTAGARSKFGVAPEQLPELRQLAERAGAAVVGLHAHAGSGVLDPLAWQQTALKLALAASDWPTIERLDVGGGLGVPDGRGAAPLDLSALDRALLSFREAHPRFRLWLEPGRFLVAEAGVLLCRVTQLKSKSGYRWVGVDAGMHTLLRPMLYGAWHPVVNLTRLGEPPGPPVTIVGPICESGDVLARDRALPASTDEGDVLLIGVAGAYGASMSSNYNSRGSPREVLLAYSGSRSG